MGLGKSQGEIPVNARPSQLWKSAIGYASIQPGRYTLPSARVCSLNSVQLIRIYLTSVGRHWIAQTIHGHKQPCALKAPLMGKGAVPGCEVLPWVNKATQIVSLAITVQVIKSLLIQ